ncbi:hypothetical protein FRC08_008538 [Ceratobasidium sp. 394]|nr:hypothetical protein FRC08_008538 [Ceratobasidium sp. 394]KAG9095157.1 hypothetical protein FS749_010963 [Ceratobasidium sp. UAMH 11750]
MTYPPATAAPAVAAPAPAEAAPAGTVPTNPALAVAPAKTDLTETAPADVAPANPALARTTVSTPSTRTPASAHEKRATQAFSARASEVEVEANAPSRMRKRTGDDGTGETRGTTGKTRGSTNRGGAKRHG